MFWIAAALLAATALAAMAVAFARPPAASEAPDLAVYRDQLRELERDAERGALPRAEAEAARAEVARRLLAAGSAEAEAGGARRGRPGLGLAVVILLVVGACAATYWRIGAPAYPDMGLAARVAAVEEARRGRPSQAVAEAEVPDRAPPADADPDTVAMVERLREVLAERPDDLRGWRLAARFEAGLFRHEAAWRAQDRVVALRGEEAAADDFVVLAEQMILAAGGYVSPEAERALAEAARRDPGNGLARYYVGLMYAQGGRADLAWPIWRGLVAESPPDAPWLPAVLAQIERVSDLAGDPTPLDELPRPVGPDADAIAAAEDMSPAERVAMIGGMVDRLADRLATEGGPPEDWARLVTAYGVVGRLDAAAAVYREARLVFEGAPAALDLLGAAAERAGLAP